MLYNVNGWKQARFGSNKSDLMSDLHFSLMLLRLNMMLSRRDQNLELKINSARCFGLLWLFHNVWVWCGLSAACVCMLNHFSPCSAAPAAAFIFLHNQDHACTTKIYKSRNKNILSSLIAVQTSVRLLEYIFTPQQIAPVKRSRAANKCSLTLTDILLTVLDY